MFDESAFLLTEELILRLEAACYEQENQNAVGPCWNGAEQHQHREDDQNRDHASFTSRPPARFAQQDATRGA